MAEQKVQYVVEVVKAGAGGPEAARDLTAVATAAGVATTAGSRATASLTSLQTTGKATGKVFQALGGVIQVAGFQQFPQLTAAALVTKNTLDGLKASGVNLTANFATIGAGVVGLAAMVATAAVAWSAYRAEKEAAASEQAVNEQTIEFAERLRAEIEALNEAGAITVDTFEQLQRTLRSPSASGNQSVRDFLRANERGSAQQRIADLEARQSQVLARDAFNDTDSRTALSDQEKRTRIEDHFQARIRLYRQLRDEGLITEQDLQLAQMQTETQRLNNETALQRSIQATKIRLIEVRDIQKDAILNFAGGLASTLANVQAWTKDAGAAFRTFFADLAQSIAQAIFQMLILRALKSSMPGFFMAAEGGVFPRFMAAGGLQGVQSVSRPTYFPRYNVVAGEAGTEMMAVLARPRMMEVGGMQAVVGNAQGNKLAITSADALARGGAAGALVIEVRGTPDFEARVVSNSVEGAVVRVTNDVQRHTRLREAVKGASS